MESSNKEQNHLSVFDKGLNQESLSTTVSAKKFLRKAIKQFNQKHFDLAYKVINKVIANYPYIPRAWALRGELKDILFGDFRESENDCIEAVNLNAGNLNSYFKLFLISKKHRNYERMLYLMALINKCINSVMKVRISKYNHMFSLLQKHLFAKEAYEHVVNSLYPELVETNEKVLCYCLTEFIWDRFIPDEIRQLPGKWIYGYGYFLLTDRNTYLVNLGELAGKVFLPGSHTHCIFPNEPASEEIEERTFVRKIRYQDFDFANDNYCQPIIDGKVWDIHILTDYEEEMALLIAYKSGLFGNIDKWFEKLVYNQSHL